MAPSTARVHHLDQVYELNRLFLSFLQRQAKTGRDCLGLSEHARGVLIGAAPATLARAAEFPRALFSVKLADATGRDVFAAHESREVRARHTLQLTILLSIWNFCRQSAYEARAFFGLSQDSVRRLRTTPLSQLPALALGSDLLVCAFDDSEWLWQQLLCEGSRENHEQLALVALQPRLQASSPRRRAPRRSS